MAVTDVYFALSALGAGDGSSPANAAEGDPAGSFPGGISSFNFAGSDALRAWYIRDPAVSTAYSFTTGLAQASFANPPTVANQLMFAGCLPNGTPIDPDPDWTADTPPTWKDSLPLFETTTNILTINLTNGCFARSIAFKASGRNGPMLQNVVLDGCSAINETAGTSVSALLANLAAAARPVNSYLACLGISYAAVVDVTANAQFNAANCRIEGVTSGLGSGNRRGISLVAFGPSVSIDRLCVFNVAGIGLLVSGQDTLDAIRHCLFYNCGGDAIEVTRSTLAHPAGVRAKGLMVVGSGGYGLQRVTNFGIYLRDSRMRDNASGNLDGVGNYPTDFNTDFTDIYANQAAADAAEFVDAPNGDFRIKAGCPIWGMGYGVSDQPSSGSSGPRRRITNFCGGLAP